MAMLTPEAVAPATPIRGQGGHLEVVAELVAGRTRFTQVRQVPPLGISRAMLIDPARPRMAGAILTSAAGGVLQGDALTTEIRVGRDAWLVLGTQGATRFHRMPDAAARIRTRYHVAAGAWLEVIPDPWIPYAGASITSQTACDVDPDGVLVLGEVVTAGRVARGERLAFRHLESVVDLAVAGIPVARDVVRIGRGPVVAGGSAADPLGGFEAVGSLLVVGRGVTGAALAEATDGHAGGDAWAGASDLPGGAGAWLRVLASDPTTASTVIRAGWAGARQALGAPPPPADRRA